MNYWGYRWRSLLLLMLVIAVPKCVIGYEGDAGSNNIETPLALKSFIETESFEVEKSHDGLFAWLQGHARGTSGRTIYGWSGVDTNMNYHSRKILCCVGYGVQIGEHVGDSNILVRNGYFSARTGVFVMGEYFFENKMVSGKCPYEISYDNYVKAMPKSIGLLNMGLKGERGEVAAIDARITGSNLAMVNINVTGLRFSFLNNKYVSRADSASAEYQTVRISTLSKLSAVSQTDLPYVETDGDLNPIALYLSCADNATISNNIFTAKTKTPGAYAIVLKHSKNVRITNNTFEGFDVPVLMDKYSSIIDDKGNIIKPDVTLNSRESRLYKVDLDHVQGDPRKPWWQFWR